MVTMPVYMNKGAPINYQHMNLDLRRNGSSLSIIKQSGIYADFIGIDGVIFSRQDFGATISFQYVDSPSTTSEVTYEVFSQSINTVTNYWTSAILDFSNTNNILFQPSHITLMEVS